MATILIYNNSSNEMETYTRALSDPMPYNTGSTLLVDEFRGSSRSNTLWSDRNTMISYNRFRRMWGDPIYVGFAFKRPSEGGHGQQSQHYAGTAFDVGQNLSFNQQARMRNMALNSGLWTYVEPVNISPRWVHFDKRFGTPACLSGGYPTVRQGNKGSYVIVAQDLLRALGYLDGKIDGIFGSGTKEAVTRFQRNNSLSPDGIVGCNTWINLTDQGVGVNP